MPSDLILPAFALVLVANAILIALAIRTFIGDRARERAALEASQPRQMAASAQASPVAATLPSGEQPAPSIAGADGAGPPGPDQPLPAAALPPPVAPAKSRRRRSGSASAAASTLAASTAGKPTARRRRFSMPAHEEDREKFDRSIASFLSGGRGGPDRD
jgi:hypothetical protein